jgi:hypothetical protein
MKETIQVVRAIWDNRQNGTPPQDRRSARLGRCHRIIHTASDGEIVVLTISPRSGAHR